MEVRNGGREAMENELHPSVVDLTRWAFAEKKFFTASGKNEILMRTLYKRQIKAICKELGIKLGKNSRYFIIDLRTMKESP